MLEELLPLKIPPSCRDCGEPKPKIRGRMFCDSCRKIRGSASKARHRASGKAAATARARYYRNLTQSREYSRNWQRKHADRLNPKAAVRNKKRAFDKQLLRFGLTAEEYVKLAARGCALCGGVDSRGFRLAIDHDHVTGNFRGLLCGSCNTRLGWYERRRAEIARYAG